MGAIIPLVGLAASAIGNAVSSSASSPNAANITNPLQGYTPATWDPTKPFIANAVAGNTPGSSGNQQIAAAYQGNQQALGQQQNLLNALQGQGGIGNQSNVYNQLGNIAAGTGPNPAQAMLNQATGQNVANQASLMAGQRGAGANVGLIARQAAQQGSALQQQAAGQGATMQAQQSLGALGQMGNIAGQQVSNQIGATGQNTQAQQAEQQALLNAMASYNQAQQGSQASMNAAQAGANTANANARNDILGGFTSGSGAIGNILGGSSNPSGAGSGAMAGMSAGIMAGGGDVSAQPNPNGPRSGLGMFLQGGQPQQFAQGGQARDFRTGGPVKAANVAEKAAAAGNSYSNDKIPAVLSEHEIVLPRSVTLSKDPVKASANFVAKTLAKRKGGKR